MSGLSTPRRIVQLPEKTNLTDNDVLPSSVPGVTSKISVGTLKDYIVGSSELEGKINDITEANPNLVKTSSPAW